MEPEEQGGNPGTSNKRSCADVSDWRITHWAAAHNGSSYACVPACFRFNPWSFDGVLPSAPAGALLSVEEGKRKEQKGWKGGGAHRISVKVIPEICPCANDGVLPESENHKIRSTQCVLAQPRACER